MGMRGKQPPEHPAISDGRQQRDGHACQTPVQHPPRQQKPQIAEDQRAGADMVGWAADEPDTHPPHQDDQQRGLQEWTWVAEQHEAAQNDQRSGIKQQMSGTGVQERTQWDAAQAAQGSGEDTSPAELMPPRKIDDLDAPEHENQVENRIESGYERSFVRHPISDAVRFVFLKSAQPSSDGQAPFVPTATKAGASIRFLPCPSPQLALAPVTGVADRACDLDRGACLSTVPVSRQVALNGKIRPGGFTLGAESYYDIPQAGQVRKANRKDAEISDTEGVRHPDHPPPM